MTKNRKSRLHETHIPANNREAPNDPLREPIALSGEVHVGSRRTKGSAVANTVRNISNSLFADILFPAAQSTAADFLNSFINSLIFGDHSQSQGVSSRGGRHHTSYNDRYQGGRRNRRTQGRRRHVQQFAETEEQFQDVFFKHRQNATQVLRRMQDIAEEFGSASVGDLYGLSGVYSDVNHENWGWKDFRGVRVIPTTEGHTIDLKEPRWLG